LRFFSIPFQQIPSQFEEESILFTGDPIAYVNTLSRKKAEELTLHYSNRTILTADTTVFCEGVLYNKPTSREEAISFLTTLSGKWHSVFTGLSLFHAGTFYEKVEETKILFHTLTHEQIHLYLERINFLDKAGGYAIQQCGGLIVKKIEGCYYNVMGLPLHSCHTLLLHAGVDLWHHLKIL
jgi:septum formation protein